MNNRIEYGGYVIEPTTQRKSQAHGWTLQVLITPMGRSTGVRRCRASNTYESEAEAVARCYEFGRQIVDGKLKPRTVG